MQLIREELDGLMMIPLISLLVRELELRQLVT